MKKAVKIVVFFILPAILFLVIIALIALPYVAKNYINKHGKEYVGRVMSVNQVKINYFTTTLNVIGFKMLEANDRETFVAFDTLMIDINPIRLFSSELEIEKIRLVNPVATIIRNDTLFNFDDIIAFYHSKPGDTDTVPSEPFKYVLRNITLENGTFTFTDKGVNHTSIMKNLGFSVPYISYSEEEISEAGLKFYLENKLIIRNAKLGKKSGGLVNIPLILALYLLKDIHGDIILDLPLTGNLNDPQTKIGRLVWQTLKNVVVKVVATPFLALSGLMGVGSA